MDNDFKIVSNSLEDTDKIAQAFIEALGNKGTLLCLYGDIGAGKTTLTKSIGKYLGISQKITSPSFVILNEYHTGSLDLYHFDLYRLETEGLDTILDEIKEYTQDEKSLAIVEWAQFSAGELPDNRIELQISYLGETEREFVFKGYGENNTKVIEKIGELIG